MKEITDIKIEENKSPKFIKSILVKYQRDGEDRVWEMINRHDSVHILIHNIQTSEIILVKQVRIPVLINDKKNNGEVYEACAGIVDKDSDIQQIAKEEILEECGYDVPKEDVFLIKTLKSGVGSSGNNAHIFMATVNEAQKINEGGGLESEDIEVIKIKVNKLQDFMFNNTFDTDAVTMFLCTFFLANQNKWTQKNYECTFKA